MRKCLSRASVEPPLTSVSNPWMWLNPICYFPDAQQGFGNLDGEYWLGLEHLYWLTAQAQYKLRVAMEDWQGRQVFAEYNDFRLEPESDGYRLRLGSYSGNAGDSLSWHSNKAFTTLDRDKDAYSGSTLPQHTSFLCSLYSYRAVCICSLTICDMYLTSILTHRLSLTECFPICFYTSTGIARC